MKPKGTVAKEKDPNPSHQLYKLLIISHTIKQPDSVYGVYKRSLRAPTKENTLVLIVLGIGGKDTQE